jgi:recombinational DNA repair ATPase RecF
MITDLKLINYKALKEAAVPIGKLNLLVGPNASGKSTILSAIHSMSWPYWRFGTENRPQVLTPMFRSGTRFMALEIGITEVHRAITV